MNGTTLTAPNCADAFGLERLSGADLPNAYGSCCRFQQTMERGHEVSDRVVAYAPNGETRTFTATARSRGVPGAWGTSSVR